MSNLTGIDISLFDVVVQPIGLDPGPDAAFVAVTPPIQSLDIFVPVLDRSKRPVASVVYALWVFWVGEEHDDGKDLIAAFRRSWPCDVQSVDVACVDGLDDPFPSPFVFIVYRRVEVCGDDAFGDGAADDAAFEQIAGVVERGTEKGGNWKSEMFVNAGRVDDIRVFLLEIGLRGNLSVVDAFEDCDGIARPRLENHHDLHGDTEQNLRCEELAWYFFGIFQRGVGADKHLDDGYRLAILLVGEQFRTFASRASSKVAVQDNAQFDKFPFPAHGEKCPREEAGRF